MYFFRKMGSISHRLSNSKSGQSIDSSVNETAREIADFFDAEYYLNTNEDVRSSGIDPVVHYVRFGWQEGRDPSPSFSTYEYLTENPDVLRLKMNPLEHFAKTLQKGEDVKGASEKILAVVEKEFDEDFYRRRYKKSLPADSIPIEYFCKIGWRQGHDPNRWFSTSHYITTNPDIKASGVNPFWHYLVAGKEEGRTPQGNRCWKTDKASYLKPLNAVMREWIKRDAAPRLFSKTALMEILGPELSKNTALVSFSHDDYRKVPGGVQLCIGLEEMQAKKMGMRHLNLHPWQTLPTLAETGTDPILCLVLDGDLVGYARTSVLGEVFAALIDVEVSIVCHHLAGHSPEGIVAIANAAGIKSCKFWLHDYFALCTSYTLMRNNIDGCGAPDISSNACALCVYGEERRSQKARLEYVFDNLDVHLISPSKVALKVWKEGCGLVPKSIVTQPHVTLHKKPLVAKDAIQFPKPVRIGFVGALSAHKGWPVFEELMRSLQDDPRFEFWVFNGMDADIPDVHHIHVHARSEEPRATMTALKDAQIDLVLHWAIWQETFSFSTFEALAAGAFVVTNTGSGNVAAAVKERDAGCVFESPDALYESAKGDRLILLAERSRKLRMKQEYELEFSDMSVATTHPEMEST